MSAGALAETGRNHRTQGPTWATGREMDAGRRRPALSSSDGSLLVTPHGLGTDLVTAQPQACTAVLDYANRKVTVTVYALMPRYCSPKNPSYSEVWADALSIASGTMVFNLPPDGEESYITVVHSPMHGAASPTARWYAVDNDVWPTFPADTATEAAEWPGNHDYDVVLGFIVIDDAGKTSVTGSCAGNFGYGSLSGVASARRPLILSRPYLGWWQYSETYGRFYFGVPSIAESPTGNYVDVGAGFDGKVYAKVDYQYGAITLVTLSTPVTGYAIIEAATVKTDANKRLTAFEPVAWEREALVGAVKTQGWSGSFTVSGKTYSVYQGRIYNEA